jgi:hypothetical protein
MTITTRAAAKTSKLDRFRVVDFMISLPATTASVPLHTITRA